jgi:glutamate dehydrogenase/leucine dehydrogenase
VATSGLEMSQNSLRLSWTREEVDNRFLIIMKSIHKNCYDTAEAYDCLSPAKQEIHRNYCSMGKIEE